MYFGIVPVFLIFLPYRILTGTPLTTYHATQFFVVLIIIGIFSLFYLLSKIFFKKIPLAIYLFLSTAFSVMSVWYSAAEPALYCTAITSGIALQIWSLYFFIRAVWYEKEENRQIKLAFVGSIFGALVFGCRPSIGLANILVIPMLVRFLKQHKFSFKLLLKILFAALPYVVIGILLMLYNYMRFDNPFEFGYTYQLTLIDQTKFKFEFSIETIKYALNQIKNKFFKFPTLYNSLETDGIFFNFPILFLVFMVFKRSTIRNIKKNKLLLLTFILILIVFLISIIDVISSPFLYERYNMDVYFLIGILCFIVICIEYNACNKRKRKYFYCIILLLSVITIISSFWFYIEVAGNQIHSENTEILNISKK